MFFNGIDGGRSSVILEVMALPEQELFDFSNQSRSEKAFTVSQLTSVIREVLENNVGRVSVIGEVSNLRVQSSGHCYFSLKDDSAVLAAVLFRGTCQGALKTLHDGALIEVEGEITVYEARGQYQIVVKKVRPAGKGELIARLEAIKKKLAAEGLFDASKKRPLPRHIRRLIVMTSFAGAALRDFLKVLERRCPATEVLLIEIPVQGESAAATIALKLQQLRSWLNSAKISADALALVRGGGSVEDLWPFNDEALARALAQFPIPTITGIGHETDITIADFVADVRAPTPSAAAEILSRDAQLILERLVEISSRMRALTKILLEKKQQSFVLLSSSSVLQRPRKIIELFSQRLDDFDNDLRNATARTIASFKQRLSSRLPLLIKYSPALALAQAKLRLQTSSTKLSLMNPQNVLRLGYSWVTDSQGRFIRRTSQISQGQHLQVTVSDGSFGVIVSDLVDQK